MSGIHLAERGRGPVLLCLHGIGSSSRSFAPQLDGLSGDLRVVAWDAPGYGQSVDPTSAPAIGDYAAAVAGVIDRLGEPVHLLGVSWGGVIACQVALDRPQSLRSLLLVGASRGSGRDPSAAAAMRDRAAELAAVGPAEFARRRAPRLLSRAAPPPLVDEVIRTMGEAIRLPGYGYAAEAMASTDLSGRLAEITTPALVLFGADDDVTGPVEGRALAGGIPGAASVPIPGAGHLANLERPDAVNAWVVAYTRISERLHDLSTPKGTAA